MYVTLLSKVEKVVRTVIEQPKQDMTDEWMNMMFAPEKYMEYKQEERNRKHKADMVVAGATVVAVVGEVIHLARKSDTVKNFLKR